MMRRLRAVMACGMALLFVVGMVSFADAAGVLNWNVTVKNTSEGPAEVTLFSGTYGDYEQTQLIGVGKSYTFVTRSSCPKALWAWVQGPGSLPRTCMNGYESRGGMCTAVCENSNWTFVLVGGPPKYGGEWKFHKE